MFLIRYGTNAANSAFTVLKLSPQPTEVEYPDRRNVTTKAGKDGSIIVQRPMRDSRPRKWQWTGGWPYWLTTYENQWAVLETLDVRSREQAGLNPVVYVWENDSGEGGFDKLTSGTVPDGTYSNVVWTAVRITQVTRKTRKGGGPTRYDDSTVEFVIEDASYTRF